MDLDKFNEQLQNYFKWGQTEIEIDSGYSNILQQLVDVTMDFPETPGDFKIPVIKKPKQYKKVVLVSGGADSTIMWHINRHEESKIGLFVDVGQSYSQEEEIAVKRYVENVKIIRNKMYSSEEWKHIIPNRNFYLITEAEKLVEHEGEIWLGAVQGETNEYSGDKSELFFRLFEELIWKTKRKIISIKTLKEKTKNDWLKQYINETGDKSIVTNTITCFSGKDGRPCGECQACVRKKISMVYCGVTDDIFLKDPFVHGVEYVEKYKKKMRECLEKRDFTHYSEDRCIQDLQILEEIKTDEH